MTSARGRTAGSDAGEAAIEVGHLVPDVEMLAVRLGAVDYLVEEGLATSMFLSLRLPQPLLLEGEAGVGKTEAAKALAAVLDTPLIRLQCYEGIDAAEALYEWNYPRQLLAIRLAEARGTELSEGDLFSREYLSRRPLLAALEHPGPRPAVLLIDEIDRADDDFEAFLLELLAEATVTIPEIGTITATHPPIIVLTSNRTRDLHDAVKRRCLYQWIEYPAPAREVEIVRRRVRGAPDGLAVQVVDAVARMREAEVQKPPGIAEAIDWLAALAALGLTELDAAAAERTLGSVLKYREDQEVVRSSGPGDDGGREAVKVSAHVLPLPELAAVFGRRLREAGLPVGPERSAQFADALHVVRPVGRRRLYWTARAVFVSERTQVAVFDAVFAQVFGTRGTAEDHQPVIEEPATATDSVPSQSNVGVSGELTDDVAGAPAPSLAPDPTPDSERDADERELPVGIVASADEVLRAKRFDALSPAELLALQRLMSDLTVHTPTRRTRRYEHRRHGRRIDLRRSLRASLRTGGDPVRLRHRQRRLLPRRIVLLCDISGSMEPYARAYLQFLACAMGAGPRAEAFVFATQLTRVTRALRTRSPDRAIRQAAAAAPDWSSGTRIGDALKEFNDRHGRRGMARGAVIVILSDGWERGEPDLVAQEMERLARLADRIVWVNPRAAVPGFSPRTGGMAAALPHCDALVSGESLAALEEVVTAIASSRGPEVEPGAAYPESEPDEEWASATPVPGSSVAMPSGYGPRRGRTTPGWGLGN